MSTLIKPDLTFSWPPDNEPYLDLHLWMKLFDKGKGPLSGVIFKPEEIICIGMKHGVGMCGGDYHIDYLHRYQGHKGGKLDRDGKWLREHVDTDSYKFYSTLFCNEEQNN